MNKLLFMVKTDDLEKTKHFAEQIRNEDIICMPEDVRLFVIDEENNVVEVT